MEIKNCSIYPRYEESLPKISRIPEFALFMYHRHGKSNRVKCLPHSNGQALRRQRLEPCAGQLARTVLRGGGRSNAISLPDYVDPQVQRGLGLAGVEADHRQAGVG